MRALLQRADHGLQAVSYVLGGSVLLLAVAVAATSLGPEQIAGWAREVFGLTFLALVGGLILAAVYCWVRLLSAQPAELEVWLEAGLQAAAAVTTLALTYTLYGISLGIGTLAERELTPETVQAIVAELTAQFSLAFMTTVVGLPASAVLRALLSVTAAKHRIAPVPAAPGSGRAAETPARPEPAVAPVVRPVDREV
jgi:hypothetical protein